jgi:uncharacterized protein (TIGR02001 family)
MKSFKVGLLAAVASFAMGGAAFAQDDAEPLALSFNVGAATDYVFRGISQTDEDPQVFGGIDATIGGIGYAGLWVSNVDFNNSTDMEYDVYAGIKPTVGPVSLDFGVIYYGYLDSPKGSNQDYVEFKAAGSVPAGPATIGAAVYYSDDFFGGTGHATYYELNAASPIGDSKFSVSGAVGHQSVVGPLDYNTWNVGVGYAFNDHLGIDVRYAGADEDFGDISDDRVFATLKATF